MGRRETTAYLIESCALPRSSSEKMDAIGAISVPTFPVVFSLVYADLSDVNHAHASFSLGKSLFI